MKKVLYVLCAAVAVSSSTCLAGGYSCQSYAETVAINEMNKQLREEVAPKKLTKDEQATLSQTDFGDNKGEVVSEENGIYLVTMGVMEECLDGLMVVTKVIEETANPDAS